jgi:MraZ protein
VLFTGEYDHSIDSKLRLAIPAEIRASLDPATDGLAFYAAPGPNGALWLWPEKAFIRLAQRIEQSLLPAEELVQFDEITFPEARRLEMDSNGRIRLPEKMLARAGLKSDVVILGMRDHLELRDPQEWERMRAERHAMRRQIMTRARGAHINASQESGGKNDQRS